MAEAELRALTDSEKKSGINELGPGGAVSPKAFFAKRLHEKEQEYTKAHKPFCRRCALLDFDDLLEQKKKDLMRKYHYVRSDSKELLQIDIKDLDRYGDPERFEKTNEEEVVENKIIDGLKQPFVTGHYLNFSCRINGCKLSVLVPTGQNKKA